MHPLSGTAVITGATSGIGAAYARSLALRGHPLVIHGRREPLLQSLAAEITSQHGVRVEVALAEFGRPEELCRLEQLVRGVEDLSILVNNAGFGALRDFHEEDIEEQERMVRVHILAMMRLSHAAIPTFLRRGSGAIVNVSSMAGFANAPGTATYSATKAFMTSFSETLALELGGKGIRVQALCPGYTRSDFHSRMGIDTGGRYFRGFMSAQAVVDRSLRDLARGRVISIPGVLYRVAVPVIRLLPRPMLYAATDVVSAHQRKKRRMLSVRTS